MYLALEWGGFRLYSLASDNQRELHRHSRTHAREMTIMSKKRSKGTPPKSESQQPSQAPISRRTLRLTFAYEGSRIELVSQTRVEKITPPSLTPRPDKNSSGYWVELQDKRGKWLFHRVVPDAIRDSAEIYPANKPIARTPLREIKGSFEVLLPDLDEAAQVVVMGHPFSEKGLRRQEACRPLAKFEIRKDGKEGKS